MYICAHTYKHTHMYTCMHTYTVTLVMRDIALVPPYSNGPFLCLSFFQAVLTG